MLLLTTPKSALTQKKTRAASQLESLLTNKNARPTVDCPVFTINRKVRRHDRQVIRLQSLELDHPTVYSKILSGDVARVVAGEEGDHIGNVLGFTKTV